LVVGVGLVGAYVGRLAGDGKRGTRGDGAVDKGVVVGGASMVGSVGVIRVR